jgi:hypothetical protein
MKILAASAIALLGLLVIPDVASACSCADTGPKTEADYKRWLQTYSGVVFHGEVVRVEPGPNMVTAPDLPPLATRKVTFTVERQWKGVRGREVVVTTPVNDGLCGVDFQKGRRYLVGVEMQGGTLHATLCSSGWMHTQDEEAFTAALGQGSPPPAP